MRPLQKTSEYKGPEPPAWTLPGLIEGAVEAARAASTSYAGFYPERRAEVLRREEARKC